MTAQHAPFLIHPWTRAVGRQSDWKIRTRERTMELIRITTRLCTFSYSLTRKSGEKGVSSSLLRSWKNKRENRETKKRMTNSNMHLFLFIWTNARGKESRSNQNEKCECKNKLKHRLHAHEPLLIHMNKNQDGRTGEVPQPILKNTNVGEN